jgi:A/G-specific adenine glycosylase
MIPFPTSDQRQRLRTQLLAWFARSKRELPWRLDRDPYRIWLSEVMLQQTQVATVVPYFKRFLEKFPTIADLAAAEEQAVVRLWEGLGYYGRARNMHRAARHIMAAHDGQFPRVPDAVATLPGLGRYMVGAILSQAFEARLPILEANSQRVLCRLFAIRADPTSGPTRELLWQLSEALLPRSRVGDFNQALMEVGALVCTSTNPRCDRCPLSKDCAAFRRGMQSELPIRPKRFTTVQVREAAVVIRRGNRFLLAQRPEFGRWAGLWEFPHGPLENGEALESGATRIAGHLVALKVRPGPELLTLRHSVTYHRITLTCFEADHLSGKFRSAFYPCHKWIKPAQLTDYPVSSPQRRLALALTARGRQRLLY